MTPDARPDGQAAESRPSSPGERVDWDGIERSPEYRELVATRKRLINPLLVLTVVALSVYTALLLTAGDGFLNDAVIGRFTWSLLLIVLMTILIFVMAYVYSHVSIRKLDPLVERARQAALSHGEAPADSYSSVSERNRT